MMESSLKEHLCSLEERLLRPEVRKSYDEIDALLADGFMEFGSSGRIYNKQQILKGLLAETPLKITLMDFEIQLLAPDVVITTYRSCRHPDMRYALRSSIWKLNEGKWRMFFHQGTLTSDSGLN